MLVKIATMALVLLAIVGLTFGGWLVAHAWLHARRYAKLQDTHDLPAQVNRLGQAYASQRAHVRLTVGVYQQGRRYIGHYGSIAPPAAETPAERVIYEIGSITKVFTGILLARLVDEGVVSLDQTLGELLLGRASLPADVKNITLAQLATHTSGLPRMPANFDQVVTDPHNPYLQYQRQHLYQALETMKLEAAPGKKVLYSNLGFGLLGDLLVQQSGTTYEDLVRIKICQPLDMVDTVCHLDERREERCLHGFLPSGEAVSAWDFDVLAPAGALRSTVDDLLDFVQANLHPPDSPLGKSLRVAQEKQHGHWTGSHVGLGWQIRDDVYTDLRILWHNGGTGGFCSFLGIVPSHNIGVVVLANSGDAWSGDHSLDDLSFEILTLASKVSLEKTDS